MDRNTLLSFLLILVSSVLSQNLRFSFMSLHDGYIYPYWKTKKYLSGNFYEDAVVVRSKSIDLGDGVGGSPGYSGLFSHYHCLQISNFLQKFSSKSVSSKSIKAEVLKTIDSSNSKLSNSCDYEDASTTLVYLYLREDTLYTGVTGDSGYSIFRFNFKEKKLLLHFRSKEVISDFNTPESVDKYGATKIKDNSHGVKEGDLIFVASDGVLDVLPYSFLVAAANHLVGKMVTVFVAGGTIDENSYDLADLLESFISNLNKVSVKYANKLLKSVRKELEAENTQPEKSEETNYLIDFFTKFSFSNKSTPSQKPVDPNYEEKLKKLIDFEESTDLENSETDEMMEDIYKNEICNEFMPLVAETTEIESLLNKQCFSSASITPKKTTHDKVRNFNCLTLEDLTFPLVPSKYSPHNFKDCVKIAIPQLPIDTTIEKITKSFNSRYFSRNIALAAKFMSKDKRVKVDDFDMKYIKHFKSNNKKLSSQQIDAKLFKKLRWRAKKDDVGIASAVLVNDDIFHPNLITEEQENQYSENSLQYAESIKSLLTKLTDEPHSEYFIIP